MKIDKIQETLSELRSKLTYWYLTSKNLTEEEINQRFDELSKLHPGLYIHVIPYYLDIVDDELVLVDDELFEYFAVRNRLNEIQLRESYIDNDQTYPDAKLGIMQSFCGGGWIFEGAEKTFRLILGDYQIARITDKQLRDFYEFLKAGYEE